MAGQTVFRHNPHPHLVGHQHHAGRAALAGGNQYRDFGVDRPLHRRIIPVVRRAVAPQRKQQVGYHGGNAFQQNRLLRGDIRGDQFIKLLPALGGAPVRGPAVAVVLDPRRHLVIKDLRGGDIEYLRRMGDQRFGMAAFTAARPAGH